MKFLFLRGQVPTDRNPQEIVFDKIEDCDDVWTQLVYHMTGPNDKTELWYWGGNRKHRFSDNFLERWVPDFGSYRNDFVPDVIFCRGGFPQYHSVLKRFPKAFKIYYGAGRRFLPQPGFHNYDLILQDSKEQLVESKRKFPKSHSTLFIKPAADNIFHPQKITKEFDIVFPANGRQESFKGHPFVFKSPAKYKILNLGNKGKRPPPKHITRMKVSRTEMSRNLQRGKVGIVCCDASIDSCPRVIPEMLASGIPIVCLNETRFWREKYITPETGLLATRKNFWEKVDWVLNNSDKLDPRGYYEKELSLSAAARYLRRFL